jgi:hypothetical protein
MKNLKFSVLLPLLALVATLLLVQPSISALQEPSSSSPTAQQTQQQDPAAPPASMSQASDSQTFTGKVAKSGSKLVLKDTATKATYALDDQDTAKRFEGQTVKVTGTLDPKTNTIRVGNIEPGS